ncbi:MAG: hypothetical protein JO329_26220 [Planctomycetaceae bacterium]|nr:hypothetical protein [Planctomycetaceae bacterium]MBV8382195.1 hypothetical protein [Planctomycetaceae bacterium]MBV8606525.1 hypothetical protein [Singulisphaera sp.]
MKFDVPNRSGKPEKTPFRLEPKRISDLEAEAPMRTATLADVRFVVERITAMAVEMHLDAPEMERRLATVGLKAPAERIRKIVADIRADLLKHDGD